MKLDIVKEYFGRKFDDKNDKSKPIGIFKFARNFEKIKNQKPKINIFQDLKKTVLN